MCSSYTYLRKDLFAALVFRIEFNVERKGGPLRRCSLLCHGFSTNPCKHASCVCSWRAEPMTQLQTSCTSLPRTTCQTIQSQLHFQTTSVPRYREIAKLQDQKALVNDSMFQPAFQEHRCYCNIGFKNFYALRCLTDTTSACIARGRIMHNQLLRWSKSA